MKRHFLYIAAILLIATGFAGCNEAIQPEDENGGELIVSFTPCQQDKVKSAVLADSVEVKFTDEGVRITYYNFVVTCDFNAVNVAHTFVNGFLNITQQGSPNQAKCVCFTDVTYTLTGISKNEVNVIFINGEQVYCYNNDEENRDLDIVKSDIKYIRSGSYLGISYESGKYPYVSGSGQFYDYFVLKTDTERDEYITRMKIRLDSRGLMWEYTGGPKLALALNDYHNTFFRDYSLVMILLTEGSGGNRHEVVSVDVKNNELDILIERDPRGATDDMAYWHILIPIRKDCFNGNIVNVNIVNHFFE